MFGMDKDESKWFENDYSKMIKKDGKIESFGTETCLGEVSKSADGYEYVEFR